MIISTEDDTIQFIYSNGIEAAVRCSSVRMARKIFRAIKTFRNNGAIIITNARLIYNVRDERYAIRSAVTK